MQSAETQLKVKPELAETVCHYSGLRHDQDHCNKDDDGDGVGDDGYGRVGVNGDDFNLSLIHWAVKHNNRRLLER